MATRSGDEWETVGRTHHNPDEDPRCGLQRQIRIRHRYGHRAPSRRGDNGPKDDGDRPVLAIHEPGAVRKEGGAGEAGERVDGVGGTGPCE